jgi:hypothetical protein
MIGLVRTTREIDTSTEAPVFSGDPGTERIREPALHRRWLVTVVILFSVGYLLQYPVLVLTGIFIIVFRYGAHWYSQRALRGVEYSRDFSLRRIFPHEETVMTVQVANHKRLPLSWLAAVDHWSDELPLFTSDERALPNRPADLVTLLFSLRGNEQVGRVRSIHHSSQRQTPRLAHRLPTLGAAGRSGIALPSSIWRRFSAPFHFPGPGADGRRSRLSALRQFSARRLEGERAPSKPAGTGF